MRAPGRPRRQCPVPLCGASLRQGYLMCGHCWSRVPQPLKRSVNASWRALRNMPADKLESRRERLATYDNACSAAIAASEGAR